MSQLSVIATLQHESASPKETQEGKEYLLSSSHQTVAAPSAATSYGVVQPLRRPTLCDPMDTSTPGFPVLHHLSELAQIHAH